MTRSGAILKSLGIAVLLYATWVGMMAVHELGHCVHAWVSGGVIRRVSIPLLGFSQTFFRFNPHPHFVVWGGPIWGSVLPLLLLLLVPRRWSTARNLVQFFAGFCLIANGAYLGVGWTMGVGDAGDLLWHGTPAWVLVAFGVVAVSAGLYLWHLLGVKSNPQGLPKLIDNSSPRPLTPPRT